MKTKLLNLWYRIRHSYWFFPTLMVLGSIVLHYVMISLDNLVVSTGWSQVYEWMYPNKPEGARALLSIVAGSMITVAGVVFSITMVALTLASTQFGPRLLINFIRDTGNQVVLGTFISTFVYCLLVLRTIRSGEEALYVPDLSISMGVLLALISIIVLIYFFHHVAESIQASHIINNVKMDLDNTVNRLLPDLESLSANSVKNPWMTLQDLPPDFDENSYEISATKSGYLQAMDLGGIKHFAIENDLIVRSFHKPGDYIFHGSTIAKIYPEGDFDSSKGTKFNSFLITGKNRTNEQDIEFAMDQLVEIAVRSLSPGVNDPFTAITCIDQLGDVMCTLKDRSFPLTHIYDERNRLRVITKSVSFSDLMDTAFNQIRQNSKSVASVTIRLLHTLCVLSVNTRSEEISSSVLKHARMIYRGAGEGLREELDRKKAYDIYCEIMDNLGIRKECDES